MTIQPYLFFNGRCEEAILFYRSAIGATDVTLMRNRESPEPPPPGCMAPGMEDKILHGSFRVGDATVLASDGMTLGKATFAGFALSLIVPTPAEAETRFQALAQEGQVTMPLGKTFFSPAFGMVTDRFGVPWMVYVAP